MTSGSAAIRNAGNISKPRGARDAHLDRVEQHDLSSPKYPMPTPNDRQLEQALRDVVTEVVKAGDLESLTVKRVRAAAENKLDLPRDFFKTDKKWKDKSKDIISEQADRQQSSQGGTSSPVKAQSEPQQQSKTPRTKQGTKRKTQDGKPNPKKRQKKPASPESELEESESPLSSVSPAAGSPEPPRDEFEREEVKTKGSAAGNDDSTVLSDPPSRFAEEDRSRRAVSGDDAKSESELSVLLDDPPPAKKKRQKRSSSETGPKTKPKTTKTAQPKAEAALDPQQEEIKRLQGWLVKCGIRKMWNKELAPLGTSKAKIKHLKEMLKDAGMEGRYSLERARQIREERELKADLEAVQEGAKKWGDSGGEEDAEKEGQRPKRKLAKGFKDLAFLDVDDGEDSG